MSVNLHNKYEVPSFTHSKDMTEVPKFYKNSSGDEIADVNFYAVRPEVTRIG